MDRDIITLAVDFIQRFAVFDGSWQIPRCIDGNKRVISVNFHAKMCCRICNHSSNRTKTDDTKFLSTDLTSGKLLFLFFSQFVDMFFILFMSNPFDTSNDITGSQKHAGKNKLFHTICIGTWSIKYHDTIFCTLLNRNIINTCTCTGNNLNVLRKLHIMHLCTSYQNCIGII